MRIVMPSVELITEPDPLKRIELCGRVCYKSEDKITDKSATAFVQRIIDRGHTSVLEHARVFVQDSRILRDVAFSANQAAMSRITMARDGMTINARDLLYLAPYADLRQMENADDYATVRFVCDRGVANEFVRHRVFSFSQESTRYVSYRDGVTFVMPFPLVTMQSTRYDWWHSAMQQAEEAYRRLSELGASPQEARNVLPLSTKTELIMTGTYRRWKDVIELRRSAAAHPQMKHLMELLLEYESFRKGVEEARNE